MMLLACVLFLLSLAAAWGYFYALHNNKFNLAYGMLLVGLFCFVFSFYFGANA